MEKMKFEEFTKAVVDKIREYLPETFAEASVELQPIVKNNDLKLTGLTIRRQESGACPLIYLEQFFEAYEAGEDMGTVLENIADVRMKNDVCDAFDAEQITDFERVKDRIIPRLIGGKAWNASLLSDRPFTEIEDLAVTYHIQFSDEFSVPVTSSLMEGWGIEVSNLHKIAVRNMLTLLPSSFRGMSAVLFGDESDNEMDPEDETLFVLTNKYGVYGAAAVLDKELMSRIAERFKKAFILPSSVHEMLIVPETPDMDVRQLAAMVKSANASVVAPEDRLSEHVYRYSVKEGLRIAG